MLSAYDDKIPYELFRTLGHNEQGNLPILVGAQGMPYDEAAEICNVPIGTIRSRVNPARSKLASLLDLTREAEFGPDRVTKAALARS